MTPKLRALLACCSALLLCAQATLPPIGAQEPDAAPDTLQTQFRLPDRQSFPGDIVSIRDGILQMEADWLRGPAHLRLDMLQTLQVRRTPDKPAGDDLLLLTNGDVLPGVVQEMSPESIRLHSAILGDLTLPRGFVNSLRLGGGNELRRTGFHDGRLAPWEAGNPEWRVEDGVLWNYRRLSAEVDQSEPFTVQVEMHSNRGFPWFELGLMATQGRTVREEGVLVLQSKWQKLNVGRSERGNASDRVGGTDLTPEHKKMREIKLTMAVNPENGQFKVWLDRELVLESTVLYETRRNGRYIVLTSNRSGIAGINVLPGMVEPDKWTLGRAPEEQDAVLLKNGDRQTVDAVWTEDQEAVLDIGGMELRVPLEKVDEILLADESRQDIPEMPEAAVVQVGGGRLTMRVDELAGGKLSGATSWAEVSMPTTALQSIAIDGRLPGEDDSDIRLHLPGRDSARVKLLGIKDGGLSFAAPWLQQHATAELAAVETLDRRPREVPAPPNVAVISNGDTISGRPLQLSADTLVMESPALGRIELPRRALQVLSAPGRSGDTLRPDFRTGRVAPMKLAKGRGYTATGGGVTTDGFGLFTMQFDQSKPFTVHVDALPTRKHPATFVLSLFGQDEANNGQGVMTMHMNSRENTVTAHASLPGEESRDSPHFFGEQLTDDSLKERTSVTLAIDPVQNTIDLWLQDKQVVEKGELPPRNEEGNYMTLLPRSARLADVAVRHELAGPKDFDRPEPVENADVLVLSTGERIEANALTLRDGTYTARVDGGERRVPEEDVYAVEFRSPEETENPAGTARVTTSADRLTMTIDTMDPNSLRGRTGYHNNVNVRTPYIDRIEMGR